jgi:hypothetical protein
MRSHLLRVAIASSGVALGLAVCGSGASGGSGGGSAISIWQGYTAAEAKAFAHLARVRGLDPGRPRNLNRSVILAPR